MGTEHAGNKKWSGLKLPVGKLFSPRPKEAANNVPKKTEDSLSLSLSVAVENRSGLTSSTEDLTEVEESPQSGKPNIFGRQRHHDDDLITTTTTTTTPSRQTRRRSSGALTLLRKSMFSHHHNKEDNMNITIDAPRDAREISESFRIDPLFDDFTTPRQTLVRPPSISDLSSSETHSSRTEMSPQSTKVASLKKLFEKKSDGTTQRPPRPIATGARPGGMPFSDDCNETPTKDTALSRTHSLEEEKESGRRSPRPMNTGVRNSLVSSSSNDEASDTSSFHPTLSQKLQIGKQEIEKKLQVRKKPLIDPLKFIPPLKSHDQRAIRTEQPSIAGHNNRTLSNGKTKSMSAPTKSNVTETKKSIASTRSEDAMESPVRPRTPSGRDRPSLSPSDRSKGSSRHSRHRRTRPSREERTERRRNHSDGTSRSRGRSGSKHHHHHHRSHGESSSTSRQQTSKDRKESHHRSRHDGNEDSSLKPSSNSNLDTSPGRLQYGSRNSPSHYRRSNRHEGDSTDNLDKRHARSQDASRYSSRRTDDALTEAKKRSKSLDESLSRDKGISHDHPESSPQPQTRRKSYEKEGSRSNGTVAKLEIVSPRSREKERKHANRKETSPARQERKRSTSMDDSLSRSKHYEQPSPPLRRPSHGSRERHCNEESTHRSGSRESSHHRRGVTRHRSIESTESSYPTNRKRSISLDESLSNRKSIHESNDDEPTPPTSKATEELNALWNEFAKYGSLPVGLPRGKSSDTDKSQKVLSKAEISRREERMNIPSHGTSNRDSRSPGRLSSYHDDEGTVSSRGTITRRQMKREQNDSNNKQEANNPGLSSHRQSTSPSRRSSNSSHPRAPRTPSGRSGTKSKSSQQEKWEEMLQRSDSKAKRMNQLDQSFSNILSPVGAGRRTIPALNETDNHAGSPTARTTHRQVSMSSQTSESADPTVDKIPRSPLLTQSHYRAVNKMAEKTFHSPLADPPGRYSPSQKRINGLSSLPVMTPPIDQSDRDDEESEARKSRTATLKNHLRQLEQQHSSSLNASNNFRGHDSAKSGMHRSTTSHEPSAHTQRSTASRHQRRQRDVEDRNSNGTRKPPTNRRSDSRDRSTMNDSAVDQTMLPQVDNSPGHASPRRTRRTGYPSSPTKSQMDIPSKDLGRFLKSPGAGDESKNRKIANRAQPGNSLDSVPVSESTTES